MGQCMYSWCGGHCVLTWRDGGEGSVCGLLVWCGVSVCSVDVMGSVCDEVGGGQCSLNWCDLGSVCGAESVDVLGSLCVISWYDVRSVSGQLVWWGSVCAYLVVGDSVWSVDVVGNPCDQLVWWLGSLCVDNWCGGGSL